MKLKLTTVTLGVIVFAALALAALDVVRLAWAPKKGTSAKYAVRKTYDPGSICRPDRSLPRSDRLIQPGLPVLPHLGY